jgi:thiamine biosynthesis lipoprotein
VKEEESDVVRLALEAMATRFELVLLGRSANPLRAAGEEALREIRSIEKRFSFYDPGSEITALNRRAAREPVVLAPDLFDLLSRAFAFSDLTDGAFDPTVGPLIRCWGFYRGSGTLPDDESLESARAIAGRRHVHLDPDAGTVSFDADGVEIDLGGIGKGYAIDEAIRILRERGVEHALLHGGTSTVASIGSGYDGAPWRIAVEGGESLLGTLELTDRSLSVSAPTGKSFTHEGRIMGHVIDPRLGAPATAAAVAAVESESATESDALSTAALVLGPRAGRLASDERGVAVWLTPDPGGLSFCAGLSDFHEVFGERPGADGVPAAGE